MKKEEINKEDVIDLGSWTVPSSWDDINLKKFQEIEKYYSDKDKKFDARDVIHILCDKTIDEVNALPIAFSESVMNKLTFLMDKPSDKEPSNKITINGEEYIINVMNKLKTGEYVSVDTVLKDDPHNYAAILAIICRKEGEIYDSKFENEVLEDRIKLFEEQPITNILPLVGFFFELYMILEMPTQLSLEIQEGLNHIRQNIKNSRENGDLSALSTKRLMRKLKKLEKSIKSI